MSYPVNCIQSSLIRSTEIFGRINPSVTAISPSFAALLSSDMKTLSLADKRTADIMTHMKGFKTLSEHYAEYRSAIGAQSEPKSDDLRAAERTYQVLIERGYIMSAPDWLSKLKKPSHRHISSQSSVEHVGIVTKDRPPLLQRCLRRLVRDVNVSGRACSICVYDDSDNKASLDVVKAEHSEQSSAKVAIGYFGLQEKRACLRRLADYSAVPPDVLSYGLGPQPSTLAAFGENLNWLLLNSHGSLILSIDDDVLPRPAATARCSGGLRLSSEPYEREIELYPDRTSAIDSISQAQTDILTAHDQLLGRSVYDCVTALVPVDLSRVSSAFATALMADSGNVAATMPGIAGDAGMSRNWCSMPPRFRKQWAAATEQNPALLESHEVVASVCSLTISDRPSFMNYACGLDNRRVLPPFLPAGRGSDGLFALTLRRCFPNAYIGHLPTVVVHDPPCRNWKASAHIAPRLSDILMMAVNSTATDITAGTPEENLVVLGQQLKTIASLSDETFEEWLRVKYAGYLLQQIVRLESLSIHDSAEHLTVGRYCQSVITDLRLEAVRLEDVSATDLRYNRTAEEALVATKITIRRFGELLMWWPKLIRAWEDIRSAFNYSVS